MRHKISLYRKVHPSKYRCARCKKIRRMWLQGPNNEPFIDPPRVASMNVPGEGKVCWICRIREIEPTWRPGKPRPDIPNATRCS